MAVYSEDPEQWGFAAEVAYFVVQEAWARLLDSCNGDQALAKVMLVAWAHAYAGHVSRPD